MNITKGYQKHPLTGEMIYPCEMYQEGIETEQTEQKIEQKSDEEET